MEARITHEWLGEARGYYEDCDLDLDYEGSTSLCNDESKQKSHTLRISNPWLTTCISSLHRHFLEIRDVHTPPYK